MLGDKDNDMSNRALLTVFLTCIFVAGCASNPNIGNLSSTQRAKMASIELLRGPTSRTYKIVGSVKGLSCNRNAMQMRPMTEAEALEGVKLRAVLLGADAVIDVKCQKHSETDWVNNCWASITCTGNAIKYIRSGRKGVLTG